MSNSFVGEGGRNFRFVIVGGKGQGTNPEQLFAAGYSACFLGALKAVADKQKVKLPDDRSIDAEVDIGPTSHGFGIAVRMTVHLPGMERAQAQALGLDALAVVDRNSLAGIVQAHRAAKETGLRLVVGCRLDLAEGMSLIWLITRERRNGGLRRCSALTLRRQLRQPLSEQNRVLKEFHDWLQPEGAASTCG